MFPFPIAKAGRSPAGGLGAAAFALLLSGPLAPAAAQPPSRQPVPALSFRYAETTGDSSRPALQVRVEIAPGWHINSDAPLDEFLVPTAVQAEAEGVEFGPPRFPPPERVHSAAAGGDMLLLSGAFDVALPVLKRPAPGKKREAAWPRTKVTLRYQACDHATCFPPKEVSVER